MVKIKVCHESGFRAGENCDHPDEMWVPKAGLKSPVCPYHQLVHLDKSQRYQVNADCEPADNIVNVNWFVLPPSMEYYYRSRNYQYKTLPPFKPGCSVPGSSNAMELIYPRNDAKVYIPLEADGKRGRMICNAAHRQPGMKIFWHLDDQYIGQTTDQHQMEILASPGDHVLTLVDGNSNELVVRFSVVRKNPKDGNGEGL